MSVSLFGETYDDVNCLKHVIRGDFGLAKLCVNQKFICFPAIIETEVIPKGIMMKAIKLVTDCFIKKEIRESLWVIFV